MHKILSANLIALTLATGCTAGDGRLAISIESKENTIHKEDPGSRVERSDPKRAHFPIEPIAEDRGGPRQGSAVLVLELAGRRMVFIADEDEQCITAVDPERREELSSTPVQGEPSQLILGHDGRLYAALRNQNQIISLEWTGRPDASLRRSALAAVETESEPIALAIPPDEMILYAVTGWGRHLEEFSVQYHENGWSAPRTLSLELPREPRALMLSEDGRTAFVSHMTGSVLSTIELRENSHRIRTIPLDGGDLDTPPMCPPPGFVFEPETKRLATQGFSLARSGNKIFAPVSLARIGDPRLRTDGYGVSSDLPSHFLSIAVLEQSASSKPSYASLHPEAAVVKHHLDNVRNCLLPRAAQFDPSRASIFIACADVPTVFEYDANARDPARALKQRYRVARGATALALDRQGNEAFVWAQYSRTLSILPLGKASTKLASNRLKSAPIVGYFIPLRSDDAADNTKTIGRMLFHSSGDKRIAKDGRSCASCHPDGRDDGFTWATPDGPRKPPMLAGRLPGTAPYSWSNLHPTIEAHLRQTFSRLRGTGLQQRELSALIHYVETLPGPPAKRSAVSDALTARGRDLFLSPQTGCSNCHREESAFTDGSLHDVSSAAAGDSTSLFETPSLRYLSGTAPYFHDGRYPTLRALLLATKNTMGTTSHLNDMDFIALEAYLISLQ